LFELRSASKNETISPVYSREDLLLKRSDSFEVQVPHGVDLSLSKNERAMLERKLDAQSMIAVNETKKSDLDLLREELARILDAAE